MGEFSAKATSSILDLTSDLSGLADRDAEFRLPTGRGDEFAHGTPGTPDSRDKAPASKLRDIFIPDLRIDTLKVKARNFHWQADVPTFRREVRLTRYETRV